MNTNNSSYKLNMQILYTQGNTLKSIKYNVCIIFSGTRSRLQIRMICISNLDLCEFVLNLGLLLCEYLKKSIMFLSSQRFGLGLGCGVACGVAYLNKLMIKIEIAIYHISTS